jgi:outer membrane protein assembly factor BamB
MAFPKAGMPTMSSMLHLDGRLFAVTDGGVATCMDARTGTVVWQERLGGNFSSSPVAAAGRLYFTSDAGITTVLEAGPAFRVLARNELGEALQASPALADGCWYIRTSGALMCVGGR